MSAARWRWSVAALCALAFAVRLAGLGAQSLWYDEAFSLLVADRAPLDIIAATARDVNPPLYYLLQRLWSFTGAGEFVWRFPWAVAGTLTVAATAALGRRTVSPGAALYGAALAALSPFLVYYSQEVRMYALLGLAGTLAVAAWLRVHAGGGLRWGLLCWLALTVGVYTHTFGALTVLALAATLALPGRRRAGAAVLAATTVAALPWAGVLAEQTARVHGAYWAAPPTLATPLVSLHTFVFGSFLPRPLLPAGLLLVLLPPALALPSLRKRPAGGGVAVLLCALAVPAAAALAASLVRPVYLDRALIAGVPAWCLLLGWSLTRLPLRPLAAVLGAGLIIMATIGTGRWLLDPAAGKPPYRWAAETVRTGWQDGDAVVHTADSSLLPFLVYLPAAPQAVLDGNPAITPDSVRGWALYSTLPFPPTPPEQAGAGARRVWLVVAPDYNADWQRQAAAYAQDKTRIGEWQRGGLTVRLLAHP